MAKAELWHLKHRVHIGVHAVDGEGGGQDREEDSEAEIRHLDVGTDWAGGGHVRDRYLLHFLSNFRQPAVSYKLKTITFFFVNIKIIMLMFEWQR